MNKDELIRRIDAERALCMLGAQLSEKHTKTVAKCVCAIKDVPAVDAYPARYGRWESDMYFEEPVTRCTACKRGFAIGHKAERFQFCPNCGAKMDG